MCCYMFNSNVVCPFCFVRINFAVALLIILFATESAYIKLKTDQINSKNKRRCGFFMTCIALY